MKLTLAALVTLINITATARAAHADETATIAAAKAWLAPVLAGGAIAPLPAKDQPLDYASNSDAKACRALTTGRATDGKGAAKLARCLVDAQKALAFDASDDGWKTGSDWHAVALDEAAAGFPTKAQKGKVKASGKGLAIVESSFAGGSTMMTVYVAVGADGAVRAVWILISSID